VDANDQVLIEANESSLMEEDMKEGGGQERKKTGR
jgi:hypothetical protein